jgi:hypothetical protein
MPYNQTKLDAVLAAITFPRDIELVTQYFSEYKESRVPVLDIIYYHPHRFICVMGRERFESENTPGFRIIPWDVRDYSDNLADPWTEDNILSLYMGREMSKYFYIQGEGYWTGRKVHDVGCGTGIFGMELTRLGAEVIARTCGSESLMVSACNLIEHSFDLDLRFGVECVETIETDSDTYVFHDIFYDYGMAQMNANTMRYLAELGKEVIFTAPFHTRDVGDGWHRVMTLEDDEYEVVLSTEYHGDPEGWGPREVLRML